MAGYQSIFGSTGGGSTTSDGNYHSVFGFNTPANPSQQQLKQMRQSQQQPVKPAQPAPQPKQGFLSKVVNTAKDFGNAAITSEKTAATGIARVLPGGNADINAQQNAAAQSNKDAQSILNLQKAGKISKAGAQKILKSTASNASQASSDVNKTVKAMPSKGQLAAGFAGTAADILTAGTLERAKEGAQVGKVGLTKGKNLAGLFGDSKKALAGEHAMQLAGNATAGGLNAAAGGGDKRTIIQNAAAGALVPTVLHFGGHAVAAGVGKGASKVADHLPNASTKELATNVKTHNVLEQLAAKQEAKQAKTAVAELPTLKEEPKPVASVPAAPTQRPVDQIAADLKTNSDHIKTISGKNPSSFLLTDSKGKTTTVENTPKELQPYLDKHQELQKEYVDATSPSQDVNKAATTVEKQPTVTSTNEASTATNAASETPAKPVAVVAGSAEAKVPAESTPANKAVSSADNTAKVEASPIKQTNEAAQTEKPTTAELVAQPKISNRQQTEYNPNSSKPVTTVPIEEKPNLNVTKIKTSKLAQGVEANAVKKGLSEAFADKPEYAQVNRAQQVKAATDLVKTDPERAVRIAMGHEKPPEGLLPESAFIAVENAATKAKDGELLRQLGTQSHLVSEATGLGQRISMLAERDTNSPAARISQVAKARADAFERKSGKTVSKATSAEVKAIRAATPKVTKHDWNSFIESLKC